MTKFGLFLQVFCLIISASENRAVSVAEILFTTLSGKLDTLNRSLEILNERFDKLEEIVRAQEPHSDSNGDTVVQDVDQDVSGYTDIKIANLMVMKAMSSEKQNLRRFVSDFEKQFGEFKQSVKDIVSEVNETVIKSNETLVSKMAENANIVNEQFSTMMIQINAVDEKTVSQEDDIVSKVYNMEDRITTIEDDQIFRAEQMKSMNSSINLFNNFTDGRINGLSEQITTLHARKVAFTVTFSSTRQYSKGSTLVFDHEVYHYGSSYSTSTGKFTAPTSGTYLFTISVEGTHKKQAFAMLSDDRFFRMGAVSYRGEDVTGSNTCVFYMEKGAQAWVVSQDDCEFFMYRTTFTGVLLG